MDLGESGASSDGQGLLDFSTSLMGFLEAVTLEAKLLGNHLQCQFLTQ